MLKNIAASFVKFTLKYMVKKASLNVILAYFQKQNGHHITCSISNGDILLKDLIS